MLSLGTEFFFAFWMASKSVGLPAGSPPPVRAATSTFLISLANSLPRLASMTAFLCLVVAHLEWPDMMPHPPSSIPPATRRATISTKNRCTRRSPVSSGWKAVASRLPCRTATILPAAASGRHPPLGWSTPTARSRTGLGTRPARHVVADPLDPRRPDEDRVERLAARSRRSPPAPRTSRPAGRTRCAARSCRCRRRCAGPAGRPAPRSASMIMPAHEPYTGMPPAIRARSARAARTRSRACSSWSTRRPG